MINETNPSRPAYWQQAVQHIQQNDPKLGAITQTIGECTITGGGDYFAALARSIVFQQLSLKASQTIYNRFAALFDNQQLNPNQLLKISSETLRGAGLSGQKQKYLYSLATVFIEKEKELQDLTHLDDEAIIALLTQVKGLGVWSVQMFLMFNLLRPNVLPVDDLGLRKAAQQLYQLPDLPNKATLHELAKPWHPYCTIATWYLWRSLDVK